MSREPELEYDDEQDDGEEYEDDGPNLGPDERDRDLMDGSWEARYYRGQEKVRNWNAIGVGIALIVLVALILPSILVVVD